MSKNLISVGAMDAGGDSDFEEDLGDVPSDDLLEDDVDDDEPAEVSDDAEAIIHDPFFVQVFDTRPPTLRFAYAHDPVESVAPIPQDLRLGLKWKLQGTTPHLVRKMLRNAGFVETSKNGWIFTWGKHMKPTSFRHLRAEQKFNHYPGSFQLGRKDRLWKNLQHMQARYGRKHFDFVPDTYCLPGDMARLKRDWEEAGSKGKWILKPNASARGIGIKVISQWSQVPKKRSVLIQRYLARPMLINKTKFDLRVYAYVSSFDPLRIYICEEGLVRFATHEYSNKKSKLKNRYMHLTNYSVNKKSSKFVQNSDVSQCQGHKWGLKALWQHLSARGVDIDRVWRGIIDIVIKTFLSVEAYINTAIKYNCVDKHICHELFGFDIMLESNLKPWLIEVNISPSMASSSKLDRDIKGRLLRDVINIAGLTPPVVAAQFQDLDDAQAKKKAAPDSTEKRVYGRSTGSVSLSAQQRQKHAHFLQNYSELQQKGELKSILTNLESDDISILMDHEEELQHQGELVLVYPTPSTDKYDKFFGTPRYYNILLHEWLKACQPCPHAGLTYLQEISTSQKESKEKLTSTSTSSSSSSSKSKAKNTTPESIFAFIKSNRHQIQDSTDGAVEKDLSSTVATPVKNDIDLSSEVSEIESSGSESDIELESTSQNNISTASSARSSKSRKLFTSSVMDHPKSYAKVTFPGRISAQFRVKDLRKRFKNPVKLAKIGPISSKRTSKSDLTRPVSWDGKRGCSAIRNRTLKQDFDIELSCSSDSDEVALVISDQTFPPHQDVSASWSGKQRHSLSQYSLIPDLKSIEPATQEDVLPHDRVSNSEDANDDNDDEPSEIEPKLKLTQKPRQYRKFKLLSLEDGNDADHEDEVSQPNSPKLHHLHHHMHHKQQHDPRGEGEVADDEDDEDDAFFNRAAPLLKSRYSVDKRRRWASSATVSSSSSSRISSARKPRLKSVPPSSSSSSILQRRSSSQSLTSASRLSSSRSTIINDSTAKTLSDIIQTSDTSPSLQRSRNGQSKMAGLRRKTLAHLPVMSKKDTTDTSNSRSKSGFGIVGTKAV